MSEKVSKDTKIKYKRRRREGCTKIWCSRDSLKGCNLPHFCLHTEWWAWGIHTHPPCSWHYTHICRNHIAHDLDLFNKKKETKIQRYRAFKTYLHWLSTSLAKLCGFEQRYMYVASCVNKKNEKKRKEWTICTRIIYPLIDWFEVFYALSTNSVANKIEFIKITSIYITNLHKEVCYSSDSFCHYIRIYHRYILQNIHTSDTCNFPHCDRFFYKSKNSLYFSEKVLIDNDTSH